MLPNPSGMVRIAQQRAMGMTTPQAGGMAPPTAGPVRPKPAPGPIGGMTGGLPAPTAPTPMASGPAGQPQPGQVYTGVPLGPEAYGPHYSTRSILQRMLSGNAVAGNELLWPAINSLMQRSQTFDPTQNAPQYAGQYEHLNDYFAGAQGHLAQQMGARGLTDSSAMGAGMGALEGQHASARAGLAGDIYGQERQRQMQDQQMLLQVLSSLITGHSGLSEQIAAARTGESLQRNSGLAGAFGSLFGGLGSAAGGFLGGPGFASLFGPRPPGT